MELFMEIIALFSCILLIVHIFCPILIGLFTTKDISIDYLFSSRDKEISYSSYFDRSNRAFKNLLETLPIFIILFFLSVFNQVDNFNLALLWILVRLIYIPVYILGLKYFRASPDHGIATSLIGKNRANYLSLLNSINFLNNFKNEVC